MRERWMIPAVVAGAIAVGAAAYLRYEAFGAALSAAARNTARFSAIIFAIALASRSARFPTLHHRRWQLFWAFVAAQVVHYAFVLAVAMLDAANPLHQLDLTNAIIFSGGFGLLASAALTAGTADVPFRSRGHTIFFYWLGLSFAVALAMGSMKSPLSAVALALVLSGFIVRALPARPAAGAATA